MKLEMIDEAQKTRLQESLRLPMRHGTGLEAMEAREAASVQAAQKQKLEGQAAEEARLAALHRQPMRSLDTTLVTVLAVWWSRNAVYELRLRLALWFEGRGLGFIFGVGGEVAYIIDASEDTLPVIPVWLFQAI